MQKNRACVVIRGHGRVVLHILRNYTLGDLLKIKILYYQY